MKKVFFNCNLLKLLFLMITILFDVSFCVQVSIAHNDQWVHPFITEQAALVWPNDATHEIFIYLNKGYKKKPSSCSDAKGGDWITEGAIEEDSYDAVSGQCSFVPTTFCHHFYNPDTNDGLCFEILGKDWGNALSYAQKYWTEAIGQYNNNKGKSYWYLGRIAHLLADVSVPAHVHKDKHIPYFVGDLDQIDSYEKYIEHNYTFWNFSHVQKEPLPSGWTLKDLFVNLAQRTQYFPSDDEDGNTLTLNDSSDWFIGWPDTSKMRKSCEHCLTCTCPNLTNTNYIDETDLYKIGNKLMPLIFQYTAWLFELFWNKVNVPEVTTDNTGYASVSALIVPPSTTLGEYFNINFTLQEVRGGSKTFEKLAIVILDSNNAELFPFYEFYNKTITANGTLNLSADNYLYSDRSPGTYKAIVKGQFNGEEFIFDTIGTAVNPKLFYASTPSSGDDSGDTGSSSNGPDMNIKRVEISLHDKNNWEHSLIVAPGQIFDIEVLVTNKGDETSNNYVIDYFRSNDKDFTVAQEYYGTDTDLDLGPDDSYEDHKRNLSAPYTPGTYYVFCAVTKSPGDIDLSNNISRNDDKEEYAKLLVIEPNLQIKDINLNYYSVTTGNQITIYVEIYNSGTKPAKDTTISYYLKSGPGIYNPVLLGSDNISREDVEYQETVSKSFTFSAYETSGVYTLYIIIDPDDKIVDSDRSNNYKIISFSVINPDLIDGDVNGDGFVNLIDAVLTMQFLIGVPVNVNFYADANGDKKIGIEEAVFSLKYAASSSGGYTRMSNPINK